MTQWFLPESASSSDPWCFATAGASEIRTYLDFGNYFERLAELFERAAQIGPGSEIMLVGWSFRLEQPLRKSNNREAVYYLRDAQRKGASVRILMTPTTKGVSSNNEFQLEVAKNAELNTALIDTDLMGNSRHHQKSVLVKLREETHLFVGGMDIWDGKRMGWADVQAEVVGTAASLGRMTLEERWEAQRPPPRGKAAFSPPPVKAMTPQPSDAHRCQFVRTYQPIPTTATAWKRDYAEDGDHTYYALVRNCILNARKSIYIEDQYFFSMSRLPPGSLSVPSKRSDVPPPVLGLHDLLALVASRWGINIVAVGPSDDWISRQAPARRSGAAMLRAKIKGTGLLELLKVKPHSFFVHSKTFIFDDEFVIIGSANYWPFSYSSAGTPAEAEFGLGFTSAVDGEQLGFPKVSYARALRVKMWERLRQKTDSSYEFPRDASMSFADEVKELKRPIKGQAPFEPI